jgi:hypothetical protein
MIPELGHDRFLRRCILCDIELIVKQSTIKIPMHAIIEPRDTLLRATHIVTELSVFAEENVTKVSVHRVKP